MKTDNLISKIDIKKKNMTINNEYNFNNMDKTVDRYDEIKIYIELISKIYGVKANITQSPYYMNYTINIDLSNISEKDFELLGIKDIIKLDNKKDIINYYAKKGYKCY